MDASLYFFQLDEGKSLPCLFIAPMYKYVNKYPVNTTGYTGFNTDNNENKRIKAV